MLDADRESVVTNAAEELISLCEGQKLQMLEIRQMHCSKCADVCLIAVVVRDTREHLCRGINFPRESAQSRRMTSGAGAVAVVLRSSVNLLDKVTSSPH